MVLQVNYFKTWSLIFQSNKSEKHNALLLRQYVPFSTSFFFKHFSEKQMSKEWQGIRPEHHSRQIDRQIYMDRACKDIRGSCDLQDMYVFFFFRFFGYKSQIIRGFVPNFFGCIYLVVKKIMRVRALGLEGTNMDCLVMGFYFCPIF